MYDEVEYEVEEIVFEDYVSSEDEIEVEFVNQLVGGHNLVTRQIAKQGNARLGNDVVGWGVMEDEDDSSDDDMIIVILGRASKE